MRLSLALGVLPGLGTGLLLVLIASGVAGFAVPWPQLAQAHGQVQALGFVVLFIVAVGLQLFPRFLGAPLLHAEWAAWGALVVALGVLLRLGGQPLADGLLRAGLLIGATVGVPAGALLAGSAFHGLSRRSIQPRTGPAAAWRSFVAVAGISLGCAMVLYVASGLDLAAGAALVPTGMDEALIHLELAGFATGLVLAVASRTFGRLLLLRSHPSLERWVPVLAILWAVGLALVVVGWLLQPARGVWLRWLGSVLELGVAIGWLWLIGLFKSPSRSSNNPQVTDPTRRWIRSAFALLVFGLVLYAYLAGRQALVGIPPLSTELSAARHALGQGFLLPLMAVMAARILPIYSADVLRHRMLLELTVDLLLVGALLRVLTEAIGGYEPIFGALVSIGGTLTVAGYCVFAGRMWRSLDRLV